MERLTIFLRDLPKLVELVAESGKRKLYRIIPASKKKEVGALMVGVDPQLEQTIRRQDRR